LVLDPQNALVVAPTAKEAFDLMSLFLRPPTGEGSTGSYDVHEQQYPNPKWMAVSLDLFGVRFTI
jgi:hypothetical protein